MFNLNRDGIQFYTAASHNMAGRDQLGRFIGYQPGLDSDDEVIVSGEERFSTEDSIFVQFTAESIHSSDVDDSEDDVDHLNVTDDCWDDDYGYYDFDDQDFGDDFSTEEVADYVFSEAWFSSNAWNQIDWEREQAEIEAQREAALDQMVISHSGGGRGTKAVMYAKRVRLRPHNCLEAA